MAYKLRHLIWLTFVWAFAIINTLADHSVGQDANTYPLIGVAAGITIIYVVLHTDRFSWAPEDGL